MIADFASCLAFRIGELERLRPNGVLAPILGDAMGWRLAYETYLRWQMNARDLVLGIGQDPWPVHNPAVGRCWS